MSERPLQRFAVIVPVDAEDAVHALQVAGDWFMDSQSVQAAAAAGLIQIRPARPEEFQA